MLADFQLIYSIWDFLSSPAGAAIFAALWGLSEALAEIPAIRANSVFQVIWHALERFKPKASTACLLVAACLLAACSAVQIQKEQAIVAKIKADGKTLIVTGCKDLPAIEVLASIVPEFYPPAAAAVTVGDAFAERFCAKVKAAQAVSAPA